MNLPTQESRLDSEELQKKYDHLFTINDKAQGGSFYLQSKVLRAKERLEEEMKMEADNPPQKNQRQTRRSTTSTGGSASDGPNR